eukprot:GFKZ01015828.1.p1 GENE.GFKZ01015828.1~~GFKZ01015828.1.p1  ORF type:complete len:237 (-),score=11.40 GFKZ01015828.1:694-1404(-)
MAIGPPPSTSSSIDPESQRPRSCIAHPVLNCGRHTLFEAGTSRYLPTLVILAWRLLALAALVCALCYISIESAPSRTGLALLILYAWNIPIVPAYFLIFVCTVLYVSLPQTYCDRFKPVASISIALLQITALGAIGVNVFLLVYIGILDLEGELPLFITVIAANIAVVVVDFLLTLRMQLRLGYALIALAIALAVFFLIWQEVIPVSLWLSGSHLIGVVAMSLFYSMVYVLPAEPS